MSILVRGALERLDRDHTIGTLRELIEDIESGYCAGFEVFLDIDGIGGIRKITVEERHPLAPSFDVSDSDKSETTPPTAPGSRGKK